MASHLEGMLTRMTSTRSNCRTLSLPKWLALAAMLSLTWVAACTRNESVVVSDIQGSWEEKEGKWTHWALGLIPVHSYRKHKTISGDPRIRLTVRQDGKIDWSLCNNLIGVGECSWSLTAKGDRTTEISLCNPPDCVELSDMSIESKRTRIVLTAQYGARRLFHRFIIEAVLDRENKLRLRQVVESPMGFALHQEYIGVFRRIPRESCIEQTSEGSPNCE